MKKLLLILGLFCKLQAMQERETVGFVIDFSKLSHCLEWQLTHQFFSFMDSSLKNEIKKYKDAIEVFKTKYPHETSPEHNTQQYKKFKDAVEKILIKCTKLEKEIEENIAVNGFEILQIRKKIIESAHTFVKELYSDRNIEIITVENNDPNDEELTDITDTIIKKLNNDYLI